MKKTLVVVSLFILFTIIITPITAYSQTAPEVLFEEKYKDESIVYLLWEKKITLKENWSYTIKNHRIIKIQKEDGTAMGDVPIRYDKSTDRIVNIKAYTITPDGRKHRYTRMRDMQVYENMSMYSDYLVKVINLPEVTVGSVIDIEWTRISKGDTPKNSFWNDGSIGFSAPVKEFIFSTTVPVKADMRYQAFNLRYEPRITRQARTVTYAWEVKDMGTEDDAEDFTPPPSPETITDIFEFSSIKSWTEIATWYYALCQKNLKPSAAIKKAVNEITHGMTSTREKTAAILKYIQENFRYISMNIEGHSFEPHATDKVFRNKYGDCKDLSLLGMCMLKEAGISSNITLFTTEFSIPDPARSLPIPTLFDHVLLEVEDENGNFYIDPVLNGYTAGEYPMEYQGGYAFVVTSSGGEFKRLPELSHEKNYKRTDLKITINEDGSAIYEGGTMWNMESTIDIRRMWKSMTEDTKTKFLKALGDNLCSDGSALEHSFENMDSDQGVLKSNFKYKRSGAYPVTNDMFIINLKGFQRDGDFTEEERTLDIFLPENSLEEYTTTYVMPEGFDISYSPKDVDLVIDFFGFKRLFTKHDRSITVTERTRYSRKSVPKSRYKEVQDFFIRLTPETNQRIVIKKTTTWGILQASIKKTLLTLPGRFIQQRCLPEARLMLTQLAAAISVLLMMIPFFWGKL